MHAPSRTNAPAQAMKKVGHEVEVAEKKVEDVFDGYAGHVTEKRPPLAAYAGLMATFGLGAATLLATGARRKKLPVRIEGKDIALLGAATFVLGHTLARDEVTSFLRAPFAKFEKTAGAGEVDEETRGEGARLAIGQLIGCPYCLSPWIATALTAGLIAAPKVTRTVMSVAAAVGVSYGLNQSYAALRKLSS